VPPSWSAAGVSEAELEREIQLEPAQRDELQAAAVQYQTFISFSTHFINGLHAFYEDRYCAALV